VAKDRPAQAEEPRAAGHHHKQPVSQAFPGVGGGAGGVAAVVEQVMGNVDSHRTGIGAGSAERTGCREVVPVGETTEVRRDHRSNRALVGGAVGEAADILEDRADIQAGAATNAVEAVPLLGVGEDRRPRVVEEDQMHLLGAVGLAGATWPCIKLL